MRRGRARLPARIVRACWALALALATLSRPASAASPTITAPEAIVIDGWTGQILYQRAADVPRNPASTVKMMTALVLLRRHIRLNRVVTVSGLAVSYRGSTAGLYAGERIRVRDLLYGMLLPSGNDAAVALSQTVTATLPEFAALMNTEARRLGLWHTRFLTPNGFDTPGQVSTARDLAVLARTVMRWSLFRRIVRTRAYTARSADGRIVHVWRNTNRLLGWSRAINGVKTGTTVGAGACLVASAVRGGRWIISVTMGDTAANRFADGMALLNYGFAHDPGLPGAS